MDDDQAQPATADRLIFIAYGSNQPLDGHTPSQALAWVVNTLSDKGVKTERISRLWRSAAWPDISDPPYFNAVLQVETDFSAAVLLTVLHEIESQTGRVRDTTVTGKRYAPRVLDLDLVSYRGCINLQSEGGISAPGPVLPHPRAHERGFVMGPLAEIAPDWIHPVLKRTASDLWKAVTVAADASPV